MVCVNKKSNLKTGYTTGSSATAASKAALLGLLGQQSISDVDIRLPNGRSITIPINSFCMYDDKHARCSVIKNGGDDPDVTHGAEIVVDLHLTTISGVIDIDGGHGVGIVTKPGLGLEINKPAINPVPKKMIRENLQDTCTSLHPILDTHGIRVIISVPKGVELGPKTDNPRIGIRGGISILGTSGIVIPFSTASYAASIRQNLDVALAMGDDIVVLTTGGRSEEMAKKIVELPDHCFIQMGDFSGYTIQQCERKQIKKAYIVGFIGKLAKMAAGVKQTHVKGSKVDMKFLAGLAAQSGADTETIEKVRKANTARHVSEIIQSTNNNFRINKFFNLICTNTHKHMRQHSNNSVPIEVVLFDFDGNILARTGS